MGSPGGLDPATHRTISERLPLSPGWCTVQYNILPKGSLMDVCSRTADYYPLKVQARPLRDQRSALRSRVSGREADTGTIYITINTVLTRTVKGDSLSYFSFQTVINDWCNKGRSLCYPA